MRSMDWGRRKAGEAGLTEGDRGASRMGGWVEGGRDTTRCCKK